MEDIKNIIGQRIRELRIKRGLKQSDLAEIVGVEPRSISRIESGHHFPKDEHLNKFARALQVEVRDLFSFSHLKTSQQLHEEIAELLKKADTKQLSEIYRIIEVILK